MVNKDTNKLPPTQKIKPSASVNFHKARQLFESISSKTIEDSSNENVHSSSSDVLPQKLSKSDSLVNPSETKNQTSKSTSSLMSLFEPNPTSKLPTSTDPTKQDRSTEPTSDRIKPSSSGPTLSRLNLSNLSSPSGQRPTSLVLSPESLDMDKTFSRRSSSPAHSPIFQPSSNHAKTSPKSSSKLSKDLLDSKEILELTEQLGHLSFNDTNQLAESISFSLSLNDSISSNSSQPNLRLSGPNPPRSNSAHLPSTRVNSHQSSASDKNSPGSIKPYPSDKAEPRSSSLEARALSSSTFSRVSCLNPRALEPSLSSVLDIMELDDSSAQSSTRQSVDLSTLPSTPVGEPQPERPNSASAYVTSSVSSPRNSLGGLVFEKLLNNQPTYSENGSLFSSPSIASPRSGPTRTSSINSDSLRRTVDRNRPGSTVSHVSADAAPSPPPKSHLRSLHLQSKKKSSSDTTKPSHASTQGHRRNRTLTRKLSDPELFAKGQSINNPIPNRSVSNRTYTREEKSKLTNNDMKASSTSTSNVPARLQSLDNLNPATSDIKTQSKQRHVIDEIINTESAYLMDLILLKEIYLDGATSREDIFSPRDLKLIFINVDEIILFSERFLADLRLQHTSTLPAIGKVFIAKHEELQKVYSQYFKMHEVSSVHLQDMITNQPLLAPFLESCDVLLKEQSKSWDVHSLLIKPIQRVLKYPLLLKELLSVTDPSSSDYNDLATASQLIQGTADYYNELKKRKDVIDRIIGPKNKKQEHHIRAELNKKFFRGAQQLRKMAGIKNKTVDPEYDALAQRFYIQETLLRRFWDEVQMWTLAVEESYNIKDRQARAFLALYAPPANSPNTPGSSSHHHHHHLFSAEYCKLTSNLAREMVSFLNHEVYTVLFEKINQLIRLFNTPALLMKKRDRKLLDYDSLSDKEGIKNKGSLTESAEAYELINKELVSELPSFLMLAQDMFTLLVSRFTWIQQEVYRRAAQQLARLLVAFERPHNLDDNIVRLFNNHSLEEGILDPFVKATHALLASSNPRTSLTSRMGRSLSSETIAKSKHLSQSNTITSRSDSTQSARLSRTPATYLSPRRVSLYPGIPPQFYDDDSETSNLESRPKSEVITGSSELAEEVDDDAASISALDGSFLHDQSTRRDHLLADVDPALFNFSFGNLGNGTNNKSLLVPGTTGRPSLDDTSPIFNSLRVSRNPATKLSPTFHSKSSSTPENAILRDLGKDLTRDHLKDTSKSFTSKKSRDSANSLLIEIGRIYRPLDQESLHSSSASERDYQSSVHLSRQCSRNSIRDSHSPLSPLAETTAESIEKTLRTIPNGSSESLTSNVTSLSNYQSSESGSWVPKKTSESRAEKLISSGLNSVNGSLKHSAKSSKASGRSRHKSRPVIFECKAVFPYSAASDTELSLIPGMELRVFKCSTTNSCPWWYGEDVGTSERGWFPSSFCKKSSEDH